MRYSIIYMVAGLSSRFGGKVKAFAKVGPNNESLIEYSLNQAIESGFNKIIFIVSKKTENLFQEKFQNSYKGIPIYYAIQEFDEIQRDKPWGTADALGSAKNLIQEPFVVCNGDDIYGKETFKILLEHLKEKNFGTTIGYKLGEVLSETGGVNRGIFELNIDGNVKNITETLDIKKENLKEKNLSENILVSQNIFALHPEIVFELNKKLLEFKEKNKGDRKIECYLPVEISNLIKEGKLILKLYPTSEKWFGITNPDDEFKVKQELEKINKKLRGININ